MVDRVLNRQLYVGALCLVDSAPKQSARKFEHNIDHTGVVGNIAKYFLRFPKWPRILKMGPDGCFRN